MTKFVQGQKVGQCAGRSTDTSAARCTPSAPSGVQRPGGGQHGEAHPHGAGLTSLRKNLRIGDLLITILELSARTFVDHFRGIFSVKILGDCNILVFTWGRGENQPQSSPPHSRSFPVCLYLAQTSISA
jgi:hypothetical protein